MKHHTTFGLICVLLLYGCGDPAGEARKNLELLTRKAQALDSLIGVESRKLRLLDSAIADEVKKTGMLDSLILSESHRIDSLVNEVYRRIERDHPH